MNSVNIPLDLNAPAVHADPFETYRRFRETAPVFWSEAYRAWCLFRHADVHDALRNPAFSSRRLETFRSLTPPDRAAEVSEAFRTMERWLIFQDGPGHLRQRHIFSHGFTPHAIQELNPRIEAVAAALLDSAASRPAFDAAADFAIPFPVTVIADLFGVAPQDRPRVARWSDDIAYFLTSVPIPADACDRIGPTLRELTATMGAVVESRRWAPQGTFLDELIRAAGGDADGALPVADLMANFSLLLLAGNETTRNLIGNGVHLLMAHPEAREALREEPSLWPKAVDEILRIRSPIQVISRQVMTEVSVGGQALRPGQQVFLMLGAANHDPEVFQEPGRFDIRRANAGSHVAFGGGAHFCLGHALAHTEGRISLQRLFEAFPGLRPDPDHPPEALPVTRLMGFTRLPVRTGPA